MGAEFSPPNKKLFRIDIAGATDFSPPAPAFLAANARAERSSKNRVPFLDLAADTLPELGNKVPEKWEGLAVGPRLKDGSYVMVPGSDNDYSVTQNAVGQQFDVYFQVTDADPFVSSIQCPLGLTTGCFSTADITADDDIDVMFDLPNEGATSYSPESCMHTKVSATSATLSGPAVTARRWG